MLTMRNVEVRDIAVEGSPVKRPESDVLVVVFLSGAAVMDNCTFTGIRLGQQIVGMTKSSILSSSGPLVMRGTVFRDNHVKSGSIVRMVTSPSTQCYNCAMVTRWSVFDRNVATVATLSLEARNAVVDMGPHTAGIVFSDTMFTANVNKDGPAVLVDIVSPQFLRCDFVANRNTGQATATSPTSGSALVASSLPVSAALTSAFTACTFDDWMDAPPPHGSPDPVPSGGGVVFIRASSTTRFLGCTFVLSPTVRPMFVTVGSATPVINGSAFVTDPPQGYRHPPLTRGLTVQSVAVLALEGSGPQFTHTRFELDVRFVAPVLSAEISLTLGVASVALAKGFSRPIFSDCDVQLRGMPPPNPAAEDEPVNILMGQLALVIDRRDASAPVLFRSRVEASAGYSVMAMVISMDGQLHSNNDSGDDDKYGSDTDKPTGWGVPEICKGVPIKGLQETCKGFERCVYFFFFFFFFFFF
jgi:hypothetical protein